MSNYWLGRLAEMLPMLLGISLLTFAMFRLAPGDPVSLVVDPTMISEEDRAAVLNQLGLNDPLPVQYSKMMLGMVNGELRSFRTKQPTYQVVRDAFPVTLTVTTLGIGLALVLAFPLGILAARRPQGWIDRSLSASMTVTLALPPFLLGVMLIWLFTEQLGLLPGSGIGRPGTVGFNPVKAFPYLIMPIIVVAVGPAAIIARYLRDALTDVLREDYIRTARAKGLKESKVFIRHAVQNAMIAVLSLLNTIIPVTLGGSVIIETVFGLPGIGRVTTNAAIGRDYPVVMTMVMFVAVLTLITNLLVDLTYGVIDPRVRLK